LRDLHDDGGGAVDVRILSGAGTRRVIVDITGTTEWNFDPRRRTAQASDMSTNLRTLANQSSVFERGVLQALRRAGVRPNEPIMLIGHSQGGMIAARLAAELAAGSEFAVTHLLTAGSPLGLAKVPGSVSVLSLQNHGDLVPELDGAENPRRANWITVQAERGGSSVLGRHSLQSYLAAAGDLDSSADPSLLHWRATAAGFLTAEKVSTQVFQVRRAQ
jgi:pimeloyl-ACP methyl ester carboxylesterase